MVFFRICMSVALAAVAVLFVAAPATPAVCRYRCRNLPEGQAHFPDLAGWTAGTCWSYSKLNGRKMITTAGYVGVETDRPNGKRYVWDGCESLCAYDPGMSTNWYNEAKVGGNLAGPCLAG